MFSLIIPVYRNRGSLETLVQELETLSQTMNGELEVVFVVDACPEGSYESLQAMLPGTGFPSQLLLLSRNFGAFSAVRAGLEVASGSVFAVMAADGQEPTDLMEAFREKLRDGSCDIVLGTRSGRADPLLTRWSSSLFWRLYRRFVQPEVPKNGIDVFAFNSSVRDHLLAMREHNTTLVGLLLWLGFRRSEISYERRSRRHGRSAWSLPRKLRYLLDSTFAFSDLPIRLLTALGLLGMATSICLGLGVLITKLAGGIPVPGYTATIITVMFFGGLNSLGLGLIGEYLWRTFENTKARPHHIVALHHRFEGKDRSP